MTDQQTPAFDEQAPMDQGATEQAPSDQQAPMDEQAPSDQQASGDQQGSGEMLGAADPQDAAVKDPADWATGDEPITAAQTSYLDTLAREAGEQIPADLTKGEASQHIERLQEETGRGDGS